MNTLRISPEGDLVLPAAIVAEAGWTPGNHILVRRTEDELTLEMLPMSAAAGGNELSGAIAALSEPGAGGQHPSSP